ncbi:hypothetical protein [Arthrobacter sp. H41]|uniref:hypothetical protein n=1 Tax=Arthrobacter sp. H41 TaxID=1312978 RepID=UPI0004797DF6|nr:hypothetical protein [Arthrobacter sp. H41]
MTIRYIRVNPVSNLFAPPVRAYGNVAIVGTVAPPATPPADILTVGDLAVFTDPSEARRRAPGALGAAVAMAFAQSPGPNQVTAVCVDRTTPDWQAGLDALGTRDVQIVALADVPLDTTSATGAISRLVDHVISVSQTGADGKERIGVAMLDRDATDPTIVAGGLASDRMVYVAHKSDEDAAAAVAGTIAGYQPHVSMLLKQVNIDSGPFSAAEIDQINGSEAFGTGPAGQGVNWLVDLALIPGGAVHLGEGYTGNPGGGKKFIDIVRTIDSVSFLLKAQLIKSVGNVRISRTGLRALVARMEAVLEPLMRDGVIGGFQITMPILNLLDKPPATLSASELGQINDAQAQRVVQVLAQIDYEGAIHRLDVTLQFE